MRVVSLTLAYDGTRFVGWQRQPVGDSIQAILEDLLAEVLRAQARTQAQVEQTSRELREFKGEMRDFKDESQKARRDAEKRWGELANKMAANTDVKLMPKKCLGSMCCNIPVAANVALVRA